MRGESSVERFTHSVVNRAYCKTLHGYKCLKLNVKSNVVAFFTTFSFIAHHFKASILAKKCAVRRGMHQTGVF